MESRPTNLYATCGFPMLSFIEKYPRMTSDTKTTRDNIKSKLTVVH